MRIAVSLLVATIAGCPVTPPPSAPPAPPTSAPAPTAASVGTATMAADGTLTLELRTTGPVLGEARAIYPPNDPRYAGILEHLGGMKPGESKSIPPWPDNIDDTRVNAAVTAYIAGRGLRGDDVTIDITGADQQKRVAVSVISKKSGSAPLYLRVDPSTYVVSDFKP